MTIIYLSPRWLGILLLGFFGCNLQALVPYRPVSALPASQNIPTLLQTYDQSRDTAENAEQIRALLARDGIQRIALVTSAWHMPRAAQLFSAAGFTVLQAPTNFAAATQRPLLEWLPSPPGLQASQRVLREWLALKIARVRSN